MHGEARSGTYTWRRARLIEIGGVLAALAVVSFLIRVLDLDLLVSAWFYHAGASPAWWAGGRPFWDAVYEYGPWPANAIGIGSLVLLLVSLVVARLKRHRRAFALLALVLAIGPGLIVNLILKDQTGRPRPRDIVAFGGASTFLPVGTLDWGGPGQSFPSGHASSGFYFLSLYVLWRRRNHARAGVGLAGGLAAGGLLGLQRIAVGAHFLSDVLWSGGILYVTSVGIDLLLPRGDGG